MTTIPLSVSFCTRKCQGYFDHLIISDLFSDAYVKSNFTKKTLIRMIKKNAQIESFKALNDNVSLEFFFLLSIMRYFIHHLVVI